MKLSEILATRPELDHEIELEPGDVLTDLITVTRTVRFEGDDANDGIIIGAPDNLTGVIQYGMISAAKLQVQEWMTHGS